MVYIIGAILLIIIIMIVSFVLRKRVYDTVDQLEVRKMEIMDRDIAAELSKIKTLNLSGETQENFESWKKRWEYIIAQELPDIEEYLFDAENAADRYRFPSAKKSMQKISETLDSTEKEIDKILLELDELLDSEETSRIEIEQLKSEQQQLVTTIAQNPYDYGKADRYYDAELKSIKEEIDQYDELVQAGNYLAAKDLVEKLKTNLAILSEAINEFPDLYMSTKDDLPSELRKLVAGLKDMEENGYRIKHLDFEKDIRNYEQRLKDCIASLNKGKTTEVKVIIQEIEERIEEMYDALEREAIDRNYLEVQFPSYETTIEAVSKSFLNTKEEVERIRETYYLESDDMESFLSLDKQVIKLKNQLETLSTELDNESAAHSELRTELENGLEQLEELQTSHETFKERINNLRKDELGARDKLESMNEQVLHIHRKLRKSNLPGVPSFIWEALDDATDKNDRVIEALEVQPLDMGKVRYALKQSEESIAYALEQTDFIIEQAFLTERVIQYANRYRSRYPILAAQLAESEKLFRSYEYELALENAAKAIEEIEPGALQRIDV